MVETCRADLSLLEDSFWTDFLLKLDIVTV
jgi:hypothetical protein